MLDVEINTRRLERAIRDVPRALKYELADGMDHISRKFLKIFRQTRLQGPPGIKGSPRGIFTYFRRTFLISSNIEGMGVEIFSDSKIARLHEEGGIIKDPGGGKIAVPLSARTEMYTARGKLRRRYKAPKLLKKIFPILLKGKTYLARLKQKTKEITPLYVLKNKIRIRPRLGFYHTWDRLENERIRILNKSITKALKRS
jgi:hypothetical protein